MLSGDFDVVHAAAWRGRRESVFAKPVEMKNDRFPNLFFYLPERIARRRAAGEIRYVGRIIGRSSLDDDRVSHGGLTLQAGLLEDAVQRSWRQVVIRLSRKGHPTRLSRMLVLSVAAASRHEKPAVLSQQPQYLGDLHLLSIPCGLRQLRSGGELGVCR